MPDETPVPAKATAASGEEQAVAMPKDLVEKNAPWKKGVPGLGTGFLLYRAASAVSALARHDKGIRFPLVALMTSVPGALLGLYLIIQANTGIEALKTTFANVGLAVAIGGGILCAYAFYLRSNPALAPEE